MGSMWYAVVLMVACSILCVTAIPAARGTRSRDTRSRGSDSAHPLVLRKSRAAAWWFALAAAAYAASSVLIVLAAPWGTALGCGLLGLVACAAGYTTSGGERTTEDDPRRPSPSHAPRIRQSE